LLRHPWYSIDLRGTALLYFGAKNGPKSKETGLNENGRKALEVTDILSKTKENKRIAFSVAPMMDWTDRAFK
jgi:hypothetical protein